MNTELFSCDNLNRDQCLERTYCGWCLKDDEHFCKRIAGCFSNITSDTFFNVSDTDYTNYNQSDTDYNGSNSTEVCEIGNNKITCYIDNIFFYGLMLTLYLFGMLLIVDFVKKIIKNTLSPISYKLTIDLENDKEVNEESELLINSDKRIDYSNLYDNPEINEFKKELERRLNLIGNKISYFIFVVVSIPTIILYYYNMFLFVVNLFFFITIVLILGCLTNFC